MVIHIIRSGNTWSLCEKSTYQINTSESGSFINYNYGEDLIKTTTKIGGLKKICKKCSKHRSINWCRLEKNGTISEFYFRAEMIELEKTA